MSLRKPRNMAPTDVDSQIKRETVRLTTEMLNAIKRQEDTLGVNYLKPRMINGHSHVPCSIHDRRPVYGQLSRININFPGALLPNVSIQPNRKKQAERLIQIPVVFTRSKTTMAPTMRHGNNSDVVASVADMSSLTPKAIMTDISSLHLDDSSFPKQMPGYLHLTATKSRYMDYFADEHESDDSNTCEYDVVDTAKDKANLIPVEVKYYVTQTGQTPEPIKRLSPSPDNTNDIHLTIDDANAVLNSNKEASLERIKQTRHQRSILKSGAASREDVPYSNVQTNDTASVPHQKHRTKPTRVRSTVTTVTCPSPKHSARSKTGGNRREFTLTSLLKPDDRKRSVRFNAANEIREYTPSEPVCI